MKSLSQSDFAEFRNLYESMYTPKEELQINEELIDEIFDELVEEFIEEGYTEEDAIEIVDEAIDIYIDEVLCEASDSYYDSAVRASKKAAKGIDKAARQKRRAGQVRYAKRKAGEALKATGDKVKGAVAGAQIAGSIAKDEAKRAGRKAAHAVTSAPGKAKKGLKGFIKRQAQKVVNRMSEEYLDETGKNDARIRDNINRFKKSKVEYTPPRNWDPEANRGQGATVSPKQAEKRRRKALRQEELEATGLFSEKEIEAIMEADSLAAMQARREKRLAAQRKREGTTMAGNDTGHDYYLTPAQQKARRDAEYKAGTKKEEVESVAEADSLAAMAARRAKRMAAQRKREGTTMAGNDTGHDYYLTPAQQKKRREDEYKAGTKKEEVEQIDELSTKTLKSYKKKVEKGVGHYDTPTRADGGSVGDKRARQKDPDYAKYSPNDRRETGYTSAENRIKARQGYNRTAPKPYKAKSFKFEEVEVDEAMSSYDRNRKRAAQRAAARNAARDAGKTGVVPGVGYVTPRRERETYVDSSGTTRHKSGAKMPKD